MISQVRWCRQSAGDVLDLSRQRHSLSFVGGARRQDWVGKPARVATVDAKVEVPVPTPAVGYFPGRPELAPDAPAVGKNSILQGLADIPGGLGIEEHTEELQQLRDETAFLSQELRLLIEDLRSGALEKAIRARHRSATSPQQHNVDTGSTRQEVAQTSAAQTPASVKAQPADRNAETSGSQPSVTFNEIMAEREADVAGHRVQDSIDALKHLSQQVVSRRKAGELPLGQVPNAS